jgi:hypothetical protein
MSTDGKSGVEIPSELGHFGREQLLLENIPSQYASLCYPDMFWSNDLTPLRGGGESLLPGDCKSPGILLKMEVLVKSRRRVRLLLQFEAEEFPILQLVQLAILPL